MRRHIYIAAMVLLVGIVFLVVARLRRPEPGVAAPVRVAERQPRVSASSEPSRGFVGVVFPRQQVEVASSVDAKVAEIKVQLGTKVAAGDVVATLDAESLRGELKAAEAAVRGAEAETRAARVEHRAASERVRRLAKYADAVPGEERVTAATRKSVAATQISAAGARVAELAARVEQLRLLIGNAAIVSPFDGVVAARYVDPGAQVGPGRPIVRIISAADLWVRFAIPEERAGEVQQGSCVAVITGAPAMSSDGRVETLAPQVDTELRVLFAEARLTQPSQWQGRLQAGIAAEVVTAACTTP